MACGKCGKRMALCPVSLGLALGGTCALSVLIWTAWAMFGLPMMMTAGHAMPPATWSEAGMLAGCWLLKGFVFGFLFALIYDFISCCCKARCCKKADGSCGCGCPSCTCGDKQK